MMDGGKRVMISARHSALRIRRHNVYIYIYTYITCVHISDCMLQYVWLYKQNNKHLSPAHRDKTWAPFLAVVSHGTLDDSQVENMSVFRKIMRKHTHKRSIKNN